MVSYCFSLAQVWDLVVWQVCVCLSFGSEMEVLVQSKSCRVSRSDEKSIQWQVALIFDVSLDTVEWQI